VQILRQARNIELRFESGEWRAHIQERPHIKGRGRHKRAAINDLLDNAAKAGHSDNFDHYGLDDRSHEWSP